ncbi:hypothetical protein [Bradyrhizobium sp. CIR3A]|uniref:hypothetical protein n=1 Tax=Bradyrhizobium sp. CIR3A TaxID=2663838 RepID=UPI001606D123|nr:hypothetical protein [Bradyrhizobium sp. CIR3A]MBB4261570.1 hypothetical protein [Bradyrhizobium sp. CIR3A]
MQSRCPIRAGAHVAIQIALWAVGFEGVRRCPDRAVYGAQQPGAQENREGLRMAETLNSSKTSSRIMIVPGRHHCLMINPFREHLSARVQDELFFVERRQ